MGTLAHLAADTPGVWVQYWGSNDCVSRHELQYCTCSLRRNCSLDSETWTMTAS